MVDLQTQLDGQRQKVDVDHFDIPVRELLRMVEEGELKTAPAYQRQFRWDDVRESELIESVLLGLPVPPVFVATNSDASWELVDGLQRVSTLRHFVLGLPKQSNHDQRPPLVLDGLKKLDAFNGLTYETLPAAIQVAFNRRPIRVTALSDKSQLDVRFDLFERLNRGGVSLTAQEVRACIYRGPFNELLGELSANERFRAMLKLQRGQRDDGTREEQVLKFFAYSNAREDFDGRVTEFLNSYMKDNSNRRDEADIALFNRTIDALWEIFKGPVLRPRYSNTPVNQFEAIMVAAAEVVSEGGRFGDIKAGLIMSDADLVASSTKGTNTPTALHRRIGRAKTLLEA